jgi:hypothetical protein
MGGCLIQETPCVLFLLLVLVGGGSILERPALLSRLVLLLEVIVGDVALAGGTHAAVFNHHHIVKLRGWSTTVGDGVASSLRCSPYVLVKA